jgi:hypothetical protein
LIRKEEQVTAIGQLLKTIAVDPENIDIDDFFKIVVADNLILEDILLEWSERKDTNDIILFPINQYQAQLFIMRKDIPKIYSVILNDKEEEFIFLKAVDTIDGKSLKNKEELSGEGKLITPFMLTFEDYNKKYLINQEDNFFDLPKNGIILNEIRLVISGQPKIKLTGRAAEIAKKRGEI